MEYMSPTMFENWKIRLAKEEGEKRINPYQDLTLATYIGQDLIKDQVKMKIKLFKEHDIVMSHALFLGFSGAGKTSLAKIIAKELGTNYYDLSASAIMSWDDLKQVLSMIKYGDILFIDEIHNLRGDIQQRLLTLLEKFTYDEYDNKRKLVYTHVQKFTLIGATTHAGLLNQPFVERFSWSPTLEPYKFSELSTIIMNACVRDYDVNMPLEIAQMMSRLCQYIPRRAINTLLKTYMEYIQVEVDKNEKINPNSMTEDILKKTLLGLGIDSLIGLDRTSRQYLSILVDNKKPIGIRPLAAMMRLQVSTLETIIEPFLMFPNIELPYMHRLFDPSYDVIEPKFGSFVNVTTKGREATVLAKDYIDMCKKLQVLGWFPNEKL